MRSLAYPTRKFRIVLIAGLAISLSGCASGGVCTGWRAIYPSKADKLTSGTSRQILGHNEYGERLGCPGFAPKRTTPRAPQVPTS